MKKPDIEFEDVKEYVVHQLEQLPVTAATLRSETAKDPILARVIQFTQTSWPEMFSDKVWKPYFNRRYELMVEQGCLLWGICVIVPSKLQDRVLDELHGGHIGIVKMKALARSHIWWPGIERATRNCEGCRLTKQNPKLTPVHPWEYPEGPWKRIHIDFAGPMDGKQFSKWPEVAIMHETTTEATLDQLHTIFARWGIPSHIVTDNGPQFTSVGFANFIKSNNCKHTLTSPYHPATNWLAERFVQSLKQALRASRHEKKSLTHRLCDFLIHYRNSRHSTTEMSPAQLMMVRNLRSRLHFIKPDVRESVLKNQCAQVNACSAAVGREFQVGDKVMVRDYRPSRPCWQPSVVEARTGHKSYRISIPGTAGIWSCRADQMVDGPNRVTSENQNESMEEQEDLQTELEPNPIADIPAATGQQNTGTHLDISKEPSTQNLPPTGGSTLAQIPLSSRVPAEEVIPPIPVEAASPRPYTTCHGRTVRKPAHYQDGSL